MSRADVPVRIPRGVVQIEVGRADISAVVRVATAIGEEQKAT